MNPKKLLMASAFTVFAGGANAQLPDFSSFTSLLAIPGFGGGTPGFLVLPALPGVPALPPISTDLPSLPANFTDPAAVAGALLQYRIPNPPDLPPGVDLNFIPTFPKIGSFIPLGALAMPL